MYVTECPKCGGNLFVVSFVAECSIPLFADGFSAADASYLNTTDEVVRCSSCNNTFGLTEKEEPKKE